MMIVKQLVGLKLTTEAQEVRHRGAGGRKQFCYGALRQAELRIQNSESRIPPNVRTSLLLLCAYLLHLCGQKTLWNSRFSYYVVREITIAHFFVGNANLN